MNVKFILAIACLFAATLAPAQSFHKLWKDYDAAVKADRPRTALSLTQALTRKALDEGDDGQLVKALFAGRNLWGQLSPDSLAEMDARIAQWAAAESDAPLRAVLHSLLADTYASRQWTDTACAGQAAAHYRASVADFADLATAKAGDYVPAVVTGKDSRYFGHDLLHLIGRRAVTGLHLLGLDDESRELSERLTRHYAAQGRREAVLLLTLDSIAREPERDAYLPLPRRRTYAELDDVAGHFADLPLNVETYIALTALAAKDPADDSVRYARAQEGIARYGKEKRADVLRNLVAEMQNPWAEIALPAPDKANRHYAPAQAYPGHPFPVAIRHKNMEEVTLDFYRLPSGLRAYENDRQDVAKLIRGLSPAQSHSFRPSPAAPYAVRSDTIAVTLDEPGLYAVAIRGGKGAEAYGVMPVGRYMLLRLSIDGSTRRYAVVDALSGAPAARIDVGLYSSASPSRLIARSTSDAEGFVTFADVDEAATAYIETPEGDCGSEGFRLATPSRMTDGQQRKLFIYTDRAVYRPGQRIHYGIVCYDQTGDDARAADGDTLVVSLTDTNRRVIATDTLHTDDFGTAGGTFTLPSSCLPGMFSLNAAGKRQAFRVEEYKRPTVVASLAPSRTACAPGDSLIFEGTLLTYDGIPVDGATVRYTLTTRPSAWVKGGAGRLPLLPATTLSDTTSTDSQGRFVIRLRAELPQVEGENVRRQTQYHVQATVTAPNGESDEASAISWVRERLYELDAPWPKALYAGRLPRLTLSLLDASHRNHPGAGEYIVLCGDREVMRDTFVTGRAFRPDRLATLPAGYYRIVTRIADPHDGELTDTASVVLFTDGGEQLPDGTPRLDCATYGERRDSLTVFLSLPDSAWVYVAEADGSGECRNRLVQARTNILRLDFAYRPDMGDGTDIALAYVSEGYLQSYTYRLEKPRPEKELLLRWDTFRDRLRPGQDEEWRLRITHPDGRAASAVLAATLYDASLDRFATLDWPDALAFSRTVPYATWQAQPGRSVRSVIQRPAKPVRTSELRFDRFDPSLCEIPFHPQIIYLSVAGNAMAERTVLSATRSFSFTTDKEAVPEEQMGTPDGNGQEAESLRTDFAETAFFAPALRTDADGVATLCFTLPQTTTSWHFKAVAHTRDMALGSLDTTVVATKAFSVAPNLPRFLRSGDTASIPVTLRNLSGEEVNGQLRFTLTDAASGDEVYATTRPFRAGANGQQTVSFDCRVTDDHPLLVCRIVAEGGTFSDGEAHYLPVLSDKATTLRSTPFTVEGTGKTVIDLTELTPDTTVSPLGHAVTVEVTTRPEWVAMSALPAMATPRRDDAFSLAAAYYSLTLATSVAEANPSVSEAFIRWRNADTQAARTENPLDRNAELKGLVVEETPWLAAADQERENRRRLADLLDPALTATARYSALDRLGDLQNADGSWPWFKGMPGSVAGTMDIALMLAHLQRLSGDGRAATLLRRACQYLDRAMATEVQSLREAESPVLFGTAIRYLYIHALTDRKTDGATADNVAYLTKLLRRPGVGMTLTDKALAAATLCLLGETEAAREQLESLEEHLVEVPGLGWTFEARLSAPAPQPRPLAALSDRLSTHAAYLEAAQLLPRDGAERYVDGVRKWLMLSRHTSYWNDARQAADAVYALFCPSTQDSLRLLPDASCGLPSMYLETADGRRIDVAASDTVPALPSGYRSVDVTTGAAPADRPVRLVVEGSGGLSCGAVYARYVQPMTDVETAGEGLRVERTIEVWRDGQWLSAEDRRIQAGERLRLRYSVTADRDYDYVCLKAARPACLEPLRPLSGYSSQGGLGCYRARHDASTSYYFDRLAKGRHTLTDEFVADRPGTYSCGLAEIRCCYAPEFGGYAGEQTLTCQ